LTLHIPHPFLSASSATSTSSANATNSTDLGAIIGGVIGGLVVLIAIVTGLLWSRRNQHKRETVGLDPESKLVIHDSRSIGEGRSRPYPPLHSAHATQTATTIPPNPPDLPSTQIIEQNLISLHYLEPTNLELPVALANASSGLNASLSWDETVANKQPSAILAPLPPSPSVALSNEASSTREPIHSTASAPENVSNTQLTDEELDLLSRLSSDNVPARDIARLVQRMRAGRASGGQGMDSGDMSDGMTRDTAPPSYDVIDT
jgi:hypothetical protein